MPTAIGSYVRATIYSERLFITVVARNIRGLLDEMIICAAYRRHVELSERPIQVQALFISGNVGFMYVIAQTGFKLPLKSLKMHIQISAFAGIFRKLP